MRRLRSQLALAASFVVIVGATVAAQTDDGSVSFISDDGLATLVLSSGAVPEGSDITISHRSPEEAPPELGERIGGGSPSHYVIEPTDLTFDTPARFIRQVPLAYMETVAYEPQLLGMLAIRDDTGAWSWADDLEFAIDAASESLVLSGDIESAGQVFGLATGIIWPDAVEVEGYVSEDPLMTESSFYVQSFLGLPRAYEGHDAVISDAVGVTGDPVVATAGETLVTEVDGNPVVELPFRCVSPGETTTGLTFTLDGVGDDILIASWLELPATPVEVSLAGFIECLEW